MLTVKAALGWAADQRTVTEGADVTSKQVKLVGTIGSSAVVAVGAVAVAVSDVLWWFRRV